MGWSLLLESLETAAAILSGTTQGKRAVIPDSLPSLERFGGLVAAMHASLVEEGSPVLPRGPLGLLRREWLGKMSRFLAVTGSCTCLVVLRLESLCKRPKGGKKSQGQQQATAGGALEPGEAQLRSQLEAFLGLLKALERALRGLEGAATGPPDEPTPALVDRALGPAQFVTFVGEEDFRDLRCHVLDRIRASHRLSAARLLEVLRDKLTALKHLS